MKTEKFSDALGQIDSRYIDQAVGYKSGRKKRGWVKWCAIAACLCLVTAGALVYRAEHPWPQRVEIVSSSTNNSEVAEIPHWEDMAIYEQYNEIELNGLRYTARRGQIPTELIGESLGSVTVRGWDEYADLAGEDANRYTEAEVYSISGVSGECAVAVRYDGSDVCYAALNSYYRPETLGQFIDDLDLREHIVFNCVYYDHRKPVSGEYAMVRFDDVDDQKIWDMLLAAPEAANEYDDLDFDRPDKVLGISVSIPIFGYENISISVREQGYIVTNILDTGKMFCVGEEYTQAFIDYVLNECDGYEPVYVYSSAEPVPE